ncbi:MAG: hypothetical protein ACW967_10195 [Candidatus Hodarchaeales archaeon]
MSFPVTILLFGSVILPVVADSDVTGVLDFNQGPKSPDMTNQPSYENGPPGGMHVNYNLETRFSEVESSRARFLVNGRFGIPFYQWGSLHNRSLGNLHLEKLVEYTDFNGDGMFQENESVQELIFLGNTRWEFSRMKANDTTIVFSFYTGEVSAFGFESVFINFTNFLNRDSQELKFDIEIKDWPWDSDSNRLGLKFRFGMNVFTQRIHHRHMYNRTMDNPINKSNHEGLYYRDNKSGLISNYFSSVNTAWADVPTNSIEVTSQFDTSLGLLSADIYLNYEYFGDQLIHDPILGVGDALDDSVTTISEVLSFLIDKPGLAIITTVIGVMALSVFIYGRRRL